MYNNNMDLITTKINKLNLTPTEKIALADDISRMVDLDKDFLLTDKQAEHIVGQHLSLLEDIMWFWHLKGRI